MWRVSLNSGKFSEQEYLSHHRVTTSCLNEHDGLPAANAYTSSASILEHYRTYGCCFVDDDDVVRVNRDLISFRQVAGRG